MYMRIFPLGEKAITVEFGREISVKTNSLAIEFAARIGQDPFPGFVECVPAYAATTVFYDPAAVRRAFPEKNTAFEAVSEFVELILINMGDFPEKAQRKIEVPVSFAFADAPDLVETAAEASLSTNEFIDIFLAKSYRVYMLGFLPGFAYMGELDERIASPRLPTPRMRVPKGSVGIAGRQTGIYPLESPGGWRIIGRTEIEMFDPAREPMCFLKPGDEVCFKAM